MNCGPDVLTGEAGQSDDFTFPLKPTTRIQTTRITGLQTITCVAFIWSMAKAV